MSSPTSARTNLSAAQRFALGIAIPTFNRPKQLRVCLRFLLAQDQSHDTFEVLVVDNGPDPATRAVAEEFSGSSLNIRYTVEPTRGVSHARRRAWQEIRSDVITYLDDDVVVAPDWARRVIETMADAPSSVGALGGPIHDVDHIADPPQFTSAPETGLNLGPDLRYLEPHEHIWGSNMSYRVPALREVDAYGEELGHVGDRPGAHEDVIIQHQLRSAGYSVLYQPALQVVHASWRAHATDRQKEQLAYWSGVDDARMERYLNPLDPAERARRIRARLIRLRAQAAAWRHARNAGDAGGQWDARLAVLRSLGYMRGQIRPLSIQPGQKR